MSMSLIKIYRTPTTTNERLPSEQQNGYHGVATEQFIEGEIVMAAIVDFSMWSKFLKFYYGDTRHE